ncbi:MAG: dCTP deaminase [Candidatus Omnitrophota bacterium]
MSVKSDNWIKKRCLEHKMIEPFCHENLTKGTISFGPSSYGYDIRIADDFKIFNAPKDVIIDPKNVSSDYFQNIKAELCIVPANSFVLARSLEYFRIPRNILGLSVGKSTYARAGLIVNVTPLEPEWEGYLTICINNTSSNPVKIYANEGISQIIFLEADEHCQVSYKDKKGKYQTQKEITLSKIK